MTLSAGTRLGPYEILAPLGAGGMGEVYRARDSKLKRDVAIKVLPESLAAHPDALERFEREALAVAALSHPNILSIFDFGKQDGVSYAVMELLEGESLRGKLGAGPMSSSQAVDYAVQVAKGLAAAHEKGIVHRDLKPENLFVSKDGHVKILDFGLAKQIEVIAPGDETSAPTDSSHTRPGTVMGTTGYMSPEQVRGLPVDHRSDIFSFGAILYEMLTGRRAFKRDTAGDTMAAILRDDPQDMPDSGRSVPASIDRVVRHCLEKEPGNRFQTAKDIVFALTEASGPMGSGERAVPPASPGRRTTLSVAALGVAVLVLVAAGLGVFKLRGSGGASPAPPAAVPEQSIAVLPFVNLSADKDKEYFSDGISEELSNLLAKIPQLQVTARTSSFSFKGKNVAVPEIARQLHVTHVLEGSVRMSGKQMRITAQLVDASTDKQLWSETYDRKIDDVFAIQDEIAADVVKQLKVKILGAAPKTRQTDTEAYTLYLQATQLTRKRSAEGFAQGEALLRRALEIDPQYVPAWSLLASTVVNEVTIGARSRDQAFPEARAAATKALEIDPRYARAHASLGSLAIFEDDIPAAARHFERALELDPTDLVVLGNSSAVLKGLGRLNEAIALDEAVVRRDPVNTSFIFNLASAQNWAGRYDQAIGSLRAVLTLNPGFAGSHLVLGESLLGKGDAAGALTEIEKEANEPFRMMGLPMAYHALERKADSDAALAALIAKYGKDAPYDVAYIYAVRGEADHAFEWLDKAAAAHDTSLILLLVENLFANIHSDPRWLPFLRKLGKAPEQLAAIPFKVKLAAGTSELN
jgi:TolB-like protein/tetratricopeptide (TPR) repeat protein